MGALLGERRQAHHLLHLRRTHARGDRKTAARNDLPIDQITQVQVLDPYFYTGDWRS